MCYVWAIVVDSTKKDGKEDHFSIRLAKCMQKMTSSYNHIFSVGFLIVTVLSSVQSNAVW